VLNNELPPVSTSWSTLDLLWICFLQLLPLLLHSLKCDCESVWLASLTTLYDLLFDAPDTMMPHIDDLIPILLTLTKYKGNMVSSVNWFILAKLYLSFLKLGHTRKWKINGFTIFNNCLGSPSVDCLSLFHDLINLISFCRKCDSFRSSAWVPWRPFLLCL
jgi:hypothetical protein